MSKKLHKAIETKLDQLHELLDSLEEVRNLDSNNPDTWDSDTLYSLVEDLKAALKLLEDKEIQQRIEPGLCSLIDDWEAKREAEEDYD